MSKIVGYGICGGGEAKRYLRGTLDTFKRVCDDTIILLNNGTDEEREMIAEYGFSTIDDDRVWGENQHKIKEDFVSNHVAKLNPTYCVCLDMDEQYDPQMSKQDLLDQFEKGNALYFYILNLWETGWNRKWSFWNIRAWKWNGDTKFENRPLHCGLAPAWCYRFGSYAPYYVEHHGLKTKESRQKKIERYEKFDPKAKYKDKSYYNALKSDEFDELDYDFIRQSLVKEVGTQKKRTEHINIKEYYYVKRQDGKVLDIPAKQLDEHLKRGFTLVGKVGDDVEESDKTKIAYIGGFDKLWDEEYIAKGFEANDCDVLRIPERLPSEEILSKIVAYQPDFVLIAKLNHPNAEDIMQYLKDNNIKVVCWIFDLYWGYTREYHIKSRACFTADYVITTDGGNADKWKDAGIHHTCIRQGIHDVECYSETAEKEYDVVFVGSNNPYNDRNSIIEQVAKDFDFKWIGKEDTDEMRGVKLNDLYSKTKVVIGDSVHSPNYWSNRVVETLGRGGFLIHREVEGIKESYPNLVTYDGTYEDLKKKIKYYISQNKRREDIINKNLLWVKENKLCSQMCKELLSVVI